MKLFEGTCGRQRLDRGAARREQWQCTSWVTRRDGETWGRTRARCSAGDLPAPALYYSNNAERKLSANGQAKGMQAREARQKPRRKSKQAPVQYQQTEVGPN
jgi:hypothetical protein